MNYFHPDRQYKTCLPSGKQEIKAYCIKTLRIPILLNLQAYNFPVLVLTALQ
jgi:hypothetical protein